MTGALTRHDCQQKRQVGRSIAVRAQRLGILPKHSFPRQLFSLWLISCQILALVGLLFANRAAHGQDPTSATTLSVDVKVVALPVIVRDKHGQIVRNLTKDDFLLAEDGHPQTIRYFAQEANLSLTLGLLVDTSMSQRNVLDQERTASESFLDQMLTAVKDQAFIIHFDREVELLQDLTSSRDKLQTALASLQTPRFDRDSRGGGESSKECGEAIFPCRRFSWSDHAQSGKVFCCVIRSYHRRWCVQAQAAVTFPRTIEVKPPRTIAVPM